MKKPPVKMAKMHQEWLSSYLEIDIDPYDFRQELPAWAEEEGVRRAGGRPIDDETGAEDLSPKQLAAFKQWLIDNHKGEDWVASGEIYSVPAYLYFNEVKKLPPGTWCIHFTDSPSFEVFESGTTLDGLALSSHKREKDPVDRERNLTDELGSAEVVYGFAFLATDRNVLSVGRKYGKNAVLFQTDAGVRAWHIGDEEYQVIFPLASEYNVIPLSEPSPGDVVVETDGGEPLVFETLADVIAYAERGEKQQVRANPSMRLVRL